VSIALAPRLSPTIEDIDAELDRFNDAMNDLGYDATVRTGAWGDQIIEVYTDGAEPIVDFWLGTANTLDDFREYTNRAIDNTSVPRAQMKEAIA